MSSHNLVPGVDMSKPCLYSIRYSGRLSLGVFATALILLWIPSGSAAKELKFCGTHWPPFAYAKEQKIVSGISHELYQEAFKRLKWDVEIDVIPWSRCVKWVEQGVYGAGIDSVPREGTIHGENPTAFFPLALYVRSDFKERQFTWDLMKGKKVGMVNGYVYTKKIRAYSGWTVHRTKDEKQLVKMLNAGRLNYVLLDLFSAPIVSKSQGIVIRKMMPIVDSAALYPLFNKKLHSEMVEFDSVLSDLISEGVAEKIFRKHLSYGYSELLLLSPRLDPHPKIQAP